MKTPLQRTAGDFAGLVTSIRSDCARTAMELLATNEPDADTLSELANLDEFLAQVIESRANVCSVLLAREQLRKIQKRLLRRQ